MFLVKLKRIFKSGFIVFWRNGVISFTAILVMSAALFVIASIFMGRQVLESTLSQIKNKVDVNVYFRVDAPEVDILAIKADLEKLPEVKEAEYISRVKALEDFKEKHKSNSLIIQSLDEIGTNPLGAILNIKAREPSQYESIAKFLEDDQVLSKSGVSVVDKVNYRQNKIIIDRLDRMIDSSQRLGLALAILFVVMAVAVTFSTVRLAIYTSREEISVMRLVGASNNYVRGPFMVEGIMYGLISAVLIMLILYPATNWVGRITENFFGGLNLYRFYLENFFELLGLLLVSGVTLGSFSSLLAVRRYLKV